MLKKSECLIEWVNGVPQPYWKDCMPCHHFELCPEGDCTDLHYCDYANILYRLAEYEQTKLRPDEIIKMKKDYRRACEKRRLYKKILLEHGIKPN